MRWRRLLPGWSIPDPPTRLAQLSDLLKGNALKVTVKYAERDDRLKLTPRTTITRFEEYLHRTREKLKRSA